MKTSWELARSLLASGTMLPGIWKRKVVLLQALWQYHKSKRVTSSPLKRLLGEYDLSWVKAVQWGVNNEEEAIKAFISKTGKVTGIWFHFSGILGASPDGIIDDEPILEAVPVHRMKFHHRTGCNIFSSNICLGKCENGECFLKKDHVYWHQVQGEMYFYWKNFVFVLCGPQRMWLFKVERDDTWTTKIPLLTQFYFNNISPIGNWEKNLIQLKPRFFTSF